MIGWSILVIVNIIGKVNLNRSKYSVKSSSTAIFSVFVRQPVVQEHSDCTNPLKAHCIAKKNTEGIQMRAGC